MKELIENMISIFKAIREDEDIPVKYRLQADSVICELLRFELIIMKDEMKAQGILDIIEELQKDEAFKKLYL